MSFLLRHCMITDILLQIPMISKMTMTFNDILESYKVILI